MKNSIAVLAFCTFLDFTFPCSLLAQATPNPELVSAIAAIKVIDNHAHPLRPLKEGETPRSAATPS